MCGYNKKKRSPSVVCVVDKASSTSSLDHQSSDDLGSQVSFHELMIKRLKVELAEKEQQLISTENHLLRTTKWYEEKCSKLQNEVDKLKDKIRIINN